MKKILTLLMALTLIFALAACGGSDGESEGSTADEPKDSSSGTIGDFDVTIKGAMKAQNYEGKDVLVVMYDWTNNDDEAKMADVVFMDSAYQDGVQLEISYVELDGHDGDSASKKIQPGTTLEVCRAFVLTNDSPVDYEIEEWLGNGDKLTKTFDLAEIQ